MDDHLENKVANGYLADGLVICTCDSSVDRRAAAAGVNEGGLKYGHEETLFLRRARRGEKLIRFATISKFDLKGHGTGADDGGGGGMTGKDAYLGRLKSDSTMAVAPGPWSESNHAVLDKATRVEGRS